MSFLTDLLKVLDEEELAQLRRADLRGKEEEVLDKSIKYRNHKTKTDKDIQDELGLSKSHFDKINSVLLNKVYSSFTDGTIEETLSFLSRRHLQHLVKHEIKVFEKKLLKNWDREKAKSFYFRAFHTLRQSSFEFYEPKLIKQYLQKYIKALPKKDIAEEIRMDLLHEFVYMQYMRSMGKSSSYTPIVVKKLAEYENALQKYNSLPALYQFYVTRAWYHVHYTGNTTKIETNWKKALEVYESDPTLFKEFDKVFVLRALAESYYNMSRYDESYKTYKDVYERYYQLVYTNYYHLSHFIAVSFATGHMEYAKMLLDKHFKPALENNLQLGKKIDALTIYAQYFLLKKQYKEAFDYLNEAAFLNRKSVMVEQDIWLRMLHNAYFVLTADFETADYLVTKNLKFLNSKGITLKTHSHGYFFTLIRDIIKHHTIKAPMPKDFEERLNIFLTGSRKVFGMVLEAMTD
jgi:tetratricopeptide (TPR) repeat protein